MRLDESNRFCMSLIAAEVTPKRRRKCSLDSPHRMACFWVTHRRLRFGAMCCASGER